MSYWVLFLIIAVATIIVCIAIGVIIDLLTGGDLLADLCIPVGLILSFILLIIGLGLKCVNTSTCYADAYDLEKLYALYETDPGYICKKNVKEVDYYYAYSVDDGVYVNYSCTDKMAVEKLASGRTKVKYTIYTPSEEAFSRKAEWEQIYNCKLQAGTES